LLELLASNQMRAVFRQNGANLGRQRGPWTGERRLEPVAVQELRLYGAVAAWILRRRFECLEPHPVRYVRTGRRYRNQFNPGGSDTFSKATDAWDPRVFQLGAKLVF